MNFTLIQGGDLYSPQPQGQQSLLLAGNQIAKVGVIDPQPLLAADVDLTVVDATGCVVVPGFIDPHEHLIGAGGEAGFASRMPEILASQILTAGITTVIGLLGTDTVTRHLASLHAKASQLWAEGITAYFYTGGFELPPSTLAGSLMNDLVMIDKVIGAGEIAISDQRWVDPQLDPLAHVVTETRVGGMMSGKAGVTHFHVGPGKKRLALLHELLDNYDIPPASLYPTHINRNEALIDDGIALAKRGAYVDMDTTEETLGEHLAYYRKQGGPLAQLTVSSDAHTPGGSPRKLYEQFVNCACEHHWALAELLPFFTSNPAQVLQLSAKGALEKGKDADVLVLDRQTLAIVHLFAGGRQLMKDGQVVALSQQEQQLAQGKA